MFNRDHIVTIVAALASNPAFIDNIRSRIHPKCISTFIIADEILAVAKELEVLCEPDQDSPATDRESEMHDDMPFGPLAFRKD